MGTLDLGTMTKQLKTIALLLLLLTAGAQSEDGFLGGEAASWKLVSSADAGQEKTLGTISSDPAIQASLTFPGTHRLFTDRARSKMRPHPADFLLESLEFRFRSSQTQGGGLAPRAVFYLKDKDGHWFQSQREYELPGNGEARITVPLDTVSQAMRPVGGQASWNGQYRLMGCEYGFNIYSQDEGALSLDLLSVTRIRRQQPPPLRILNLRMPSQTGCYEPVEGNFELSREYFNPFDPEIIEINVRARDEQGGETVFPAYYTVAHRREVVRDREVVLPVGLPYWAFRFTPRQSGIYRLRLEIADRSQGEEQTLLGPERDLRVEPSQSRGFVQVSQRDPHYFEFSTGEFFFPLGYNINSPQDNRYESRMKTPGIFDLGVTSYENYFAAMEQHGLNACEVWMASWSLGIEWTSLRENYYGLGRYNLAHAAQLDAVLESARRHGIYVHLTLDNHGKLSSHSDQEWHFSPFSRANAYAVADGACLDSTTEFFSNAEAIRLNRQRNRYIAARWGASPAIFGVELWSELDLVTNHQRIYDSGVSADWHVQTVEYFQKWSQGRQPMTTHACGTYGNTLKIQKLFALPQISYVVSDAYKGSRPMVGYLKDHMDKLQGIPLKPRLITEFGDASHSKIAAMRADLHSALWGSLFYGFAGAPFTWWHEFVHTMGHYEHFEPVAKFLEGVDPRGKGFATVEHRVIMLPREEAQPAAGASETGGEPAKKAAKPLAKIANDPHQDKIRALSFGNGREEYLWIFKDYHMQKYPSDEEMAALQPFEGLQLELTKPLPPGTYVLTFYDTATGEPVKSSELAVDGEKTRIALPPFNSDLALKCRLKTEGQLSDN
jgi:hypothetical protein